MLVIFHPSKKSWKKCILPKVSLKKITKISKQTLSFRNYGYKTKVFEAYTR